MPALSPALPLSPAPPRVEGSGGATGLIEVEGVGGIILAADAAAKTADVDLAGWESTGGFTTLFVRGSVSDVQAALRAGEAAARGFVSHVVSVELTRPDPAVDRFLASRPRPATVVEVGALGIVEARGYGRHIFRNDAMVKAAKVEVWNVLTVMNRIVCTLVAGKVGDVREAVRAGAAALADPHFTASAVISRPRMDVLRAFAPGSSGGGA